MILISPKTWERAVQAIEAFAWAVLAGAGTASLDYLWERPPFTEETIKHLYEVARAGAMTAGLLYFRNKFRYPPAHMDRHSDPLPPK